MPSEIGGIIPIDLYGDEVFIEDVGDLLVFEALSFHNLIHKVTTWAPLFDYPHFGLL